MLTLERRVKMGSAPSASKRSLKLRSQRKVGNEYIYIAINEGGKGRRSEH